MPEAVIGRGAMGVVYRAHDPEIDRQVAIKLVLADLLEGEDRGEFLARFRREAQAAARCHHPNIVTVYDLATHEGSPFIAMEFVQGGSLAQLLAAGARPGPAEAGRIVGQLLAALEAAHAMGIVHRDIKPANILITPAGGVKITDFGVARLDRSDLTQSGTMIGTLSYMSPEQCRGEAVDHRADLFSAACILHELMVGQRPFAGRTEAEVMRRLLGEPPAGLEGGAVPPALAALLGVALAKAAEARFASAAAMAEALARALAGVPAGEDCTVVQRPTAAAAFDPVILTTMERQLSAHVGPIAHALVQSAARRAPSVAALHSILASGIEDSAARARFLREAAPATSSATGAGVPADVVARAQRELARFLGPIAAVLVKRTLPKVGDAAELWTALAAHIDNPAEQAAFLRTRPG